MDERRRVEPPPVQGGIEPWMDDSLKQLLRDLGETELQPVQMTLDLG